jgi:hypothetical protein
MGCAVVLFATYLYSKPDATPKSRPQSSGKLDEEGNVGLHDEKVKA